MPTPIVSPLASWDLPCDLVIEEGKAWAWLSRGSEPRRGITRRWKARSSNPAEDRGEGKCTCWARNSNSASSFDFAGKDRSELQGYTDHSC